MAIAGLDDAALERERRLPQPGGRKPAPGLLVLLQSFLNTHFDLGEHWGSDVLRSPDEQLLAWFASRRLLGSAVSEPRRAQVNELIALREGLRELAAHNREPALAPQPARLAQMNAALRRVGLKLGFSAEGAILSGDPHSGLNAALGTLAGIAALAMLDGSWRRMKACPGEHCGWVFFDHSRNNSGRWCSMAVCGGRTKARSHYLRHRAGGARAGSLR